MIFEDGIANSLSDDKSSNENSRTKVVSKRSISDDSDKQNVEHSQSHSDESWWSRAKRSITNLFWKPEEKVVAKREAIPDTTKSQIKDAETTTKISIQRRRRQRLYEDDDDDEDNEIGSADHDTSESSIIEPDFSATELPPVKDDKYCKLNSFIS